MSGRLDEFQDAGVVLVTFTKPRNLAGYRGRHHLDYPVVTDEERRAYEAYGLERGSVFRVYGLATLRRYAALRRQGAELEMPKEDTLQLGGDFVVGRDGRLTYVFRSEGPDDRPEVDELIEAVNRS